MTQNIESPETPGGFTWLRQAEVDVGQRAGMTSGESAQMRALKRKNAELERTIEILKAATAFFTRESDPLPR
jgi:transposase